MNCPVCRENLAETMRDGVAVVSCPACGGLWVGEKQLEEIEGREDRFLRWLDLDLWKDFEEHDIGPSERLCPSCGENLHRIEHREIGAVIDICTRCRAVWFDAGELERVLHYLEEKIDNETVAEYLKELGKDAVDLVAWEKPVAGELRQIATVLKLLEYRIFSRFPVLARLAGQLPK